MHKKRIGTSGTTSTSYHATVYKTNNQLENLDRAFLDQVSKLGVYQRASNLAVEHGLSNSPLGYNIASNILNTASGITKTVSDNFAGINKNAQNTDS